MPKDNCKGTNMEIRPANTKRIVIHPTNDLTGKRFGSVLVLEYSKFKNHNGTRLWKCHCESCGKESYLSSQKLKAKKNCDCAPHHSQADITGEKFGHLTALFPTKLRNSGAVVWECRCDCGNITHRAQNQLMMGKDEQHCGCLASKIAKKIHDKAFHFVEGTCIEAIRSDKPFSNNKSGVRGVHLDKRSQKWKANIGFKGKQIRLGIFSDFNDAVKARKDAEDRIYKPFLEQYRDKQD